MLPAVRTLIESSSDMLHFMIIMLSTVVAFALSGMVMYGKRLQDFATPWDRRGCFSSMHVPPTYGADVLVIGKS